ncbi:hypothetical protein HGB07_05625, partial [Candidatus Roizmanbacteria bacterium]|nr:hypothetical protein [Candidatus Roizmanbacteria bacterium]
MISKRPKVILLFFGISSIAVSIYFNLQILIFYGLVFALFGFLLIREKRKLGLWYWCILVMAVAINLGFLMRMPYFSDDIYNQSTAVDVLSHFWKNITTIYHYARFPINTWYIFETVYRLDKLPFLAHALAFSAHFIAVTLILKTIDRVLRVNPFVRLCLIVTLITLPSNVENLVWFAAIHSSVSFMFSSISIYLFMHFLRKKKVIMMAGAIIIQLCSVMSSEVGYTLLLFHVYIIVAWSFSRYKFQIIGQVNKIISYLFLWSPILLFSVLYRMSYSLFGMSGLSSPYDISHLESVKVLH